MKLHLPWSVDEDAANPGDGDACVVVSDAEGGIACTVLFAPDEPGDEDVARGVKASATGGMTDSCVDLRTIFRDALMLGAHALIVAHNHPSGDPLPSPEDKATTTRLCEGGQLLGMPIRDHIVLGDAGRYVSFRREGLMK